MMSSPDERVHLVIAEDLWIVRGFNDTAHLEP